MSYIAPKSIEIKNGENMLNMLDTTMTETQTSN